MKTDRELLALAAEAAGIELWWRGGRAICNATGYWNPLTDDGDALRLAVKLQIQMTPGTYVKDMYTAYYAGPFCEADEYCNTMQDEFAAMRRAIVRAAAEIGKAMP